MWRYLALAVRSKQRRFSHVLLKWLESSSLGLVKKITMQGGVEIKLLSMVEFHTSNLCNKGIFILKYLHFQRKPSMNLNFFVTVHILMKDKNLIDSCQAHLPV